MTWPASRQRLIRICKFLPPALGAAGAVLFVSFRILVPSLAFDLWHWIALGMFDGIVLGAIISLVLRLLIYAIDKANEPRQGDPP